MHKSIIPAVENIQKINNKKCRITPTRRMWVMRSNFRRLKQEIETFSKFDEEIKTLFCKIDQEIKKALGGHYFRFFSNFT
jgi:hypothetical protein